MVHKKLLAAVLVIMIIGVTPALARERDEVVESQRSIDQMTERKAELNKKAEKERAKITKKIEKRAERVDAGCEKIETKIANVVGKHAEIKEKHLANQNRLYTRAVALSETLQKNGLDTTKLDADLATFALKRDTVEATFAVYDASLATTKQYTCGESEGAFKGQLRTSRDEYKAFRVALKDARDFWQSVVMADIKALRDLTVSAPAKPTN